MELAVILLWDQLFIPCEDEPYLCLLCFVQWTVLS